MENLFQFLSDPQERSKLMRNALAAITRGGVAGTLGAPVDMLNLGLNAAKAGVGYVGHKTGLLSADQMPQIDEQPVGGSEWIGNKLQKMGLLSDYRNPNAEMIAGGLLAPLTSAATAARAPQIARGLLAMEANAQAPKTLNAATNNQAGAIVWHGSPHKFDKFDSSKIGTGEGAQAYGHGLYLAEAREVGQDYATTLASPRNRVMDRQGVYIEPSPMGDGTYRLARQSEWGRMKGQVGDGTQGLTDYQYPNIASAIRAAKKHGYLPKEGRPLLNAIGEDGKYVPVSKAADTESLLGYEPQYAQFIASEPGNLYKVDLPDDKIARMLDWDKPLSQQAPEVQKAIRSQMPDAAWNAMKDRRGQDYVEHYWGGGIGGSGQSHFASSRMKELGIPGIRYLDGGSRGTGAGTSNFVVFPGEENLLRILERNGQPLK